MATTRMLFVGHSYVATRQSPSGSAGRYQRRAPRPPHGDLRCIPHLFDPHYDDLFADDPAATRLRELLAPLFSVDPGDPARKSSAWKRVESLLEDLGARPGPEAYNP